jgi:serine/threonine protein kinase
LNLDPEISFLVQFQTHPNIVQTKDILFEPSTATVAIVQELLNQPLNKFATTHISKSNTLLVIYQILKAISFLYSNHYFHRD